MMVCLKIKQVTVAVAIYTGLTIKTQTYSMFEMYSYNMSEMYFYSISEMYYASQTCNVSEMNSLT